MNKLFFKSILIIFFFAQQCCVARSVVYIFAHGLGSTHEQANLFSPLMAHSGQVHSFNFDDAKCEGKYHAHLVNLGQERDLAALHNTYESVVKKLSTEDSIVLIGLSRGAATCINYVARFAPARLKALILDSPFDSFTNLVSHIMHRFNIDYLPISWGKKIATMHFKLVDPEGIFPIESIVKLPDQIPVLFVHARNDCVVPLKSSQNLYLSLIKKGHKHVHLHEIPYGPHGKLLDESQDFREEYCALVHAFYKKYNLPCDKKLANKGKKLIENAQPNTAEVEKRLSQAEQQPNKVYFSVEPILDWFANLLNAFKKFFFS